MMRMGYSFGKSVPLTWTAKIQLPINLWPEQLKRSKLRIRQHAPLPVYVRGKEFMPYGEFLASYLRTARGLTAAYENRPFRTS